jgi:predicted flap endonuclease-1-like 5' DNA nuclease
MDFVVGLVIGLVAGLLLNWVIEPLISRREPPPGEQETNLHRSLADLQQRLGAVEAALVESEEHTGGKISKVIVRNQDDLERIKGIGPVFARRLNEAGIYNFSHLSNTSPSRIRQILAAEEWQEVDVGGWIREAHQYAAKPSD